MIDNHGTPSEIIIHGRRYTLEIDLDGTPTLKRFNDKSKMWVVLRFSIDDEQSDRNHEEFCRRLIEATFENYGIEPSQKDVELLLRQMLNEDR